MGIALYFLAPVLLMMGAAACGFAAYALLAPVRQTKLSRDTRMTIALWLTPGLPLVAALSWLTPGNSELANIYGNGFLTVLWAWCLASFALGIVIGWAVYRQDDPPRS